MNGAKKKSLYLMIFAKSFDIMELTRMAAIRLLSDCVHQKLTCAEKEQLVNAGPNKAVKRTCLNSCIGKKSMEIKALGKGL